MVSPLLPCTTLYLGGQNSKSSSRVFHPTLCINQHYHYQICTNLFSELFIYIYFHMLHEFSFVMKCLSIQITFQFRVCGYEGSWTCWSFVWDKSTFNPPTCFIHECYYKNTWYIFLKNAYILVLTVFVLWLVLLLKQKTQKLLW